MAITITALTPEQKEEAVGLLARAFVTNPLHVAVFGTDEIGSNEAFFRIGLTVMKGQKLVAVDGLRILGVIHWVDSVKCQFSSAEKLRMLPAMIQGFGLRSAIRVGGWFSAWSKHDLVEHHVHLGPIGVSPEAKLVAVPLHGLPADPTALRMTGLRSAISKQIDLKTSTSYTKFGFDVTETALIHGIVNYFMRRGAPLSG